MKRSAGLTAVSICMILFGGCHALGNGALLAAPPALTVFIENMQTVEGDFERTLARGEDTRYSAEEIAEGEEAFRELRQAFERLRHVVDTPEAKIFLALQVLVGILAGIAGLGALQRAPWARTLALGQVWLALVAIALGELLMTSGSAHLSQALQPQQQDVMASYALAGWSLVWNGLILWFFSRRSTAAQFRPEE